MGRSMSPASSSSLQTLLIPFMGRTEDLINRPSHEHDHVRVNQLERKNERDYVHATHPKCNPGATATASKVAKWRARSQAEGRVCTYDEGARSHQWPRPAHTLLRARPRPGRGQWDPTAVLVSPHLLVSRTQVGRGGGIPPSTLSPHTLL